MIKQWLSKKWKPYDEPAEYLIRDREDKIIDVKMNGHMKAIVFFLLGIVFIMCLLEFIQFF